MRWVSRLLSNDNDMKSQPAWPHRCIGDIAKLGEQVNSYFGEKIQHCATISIADIQTKVVKVVTISPMRLRGQAGWLFISFLLH